MKRFSLFGMVALAVLLMVAPASAVNVPACGEFILFAKTVILMEQGPLLIHGNVFVQDPNGKVFVGSHNTIDGTVSAANIVVGTGAVVKRCETNNKTGPGTCTTTVPFAPLAACLVSFPPPPLTTPVVPTCSNPAVPPAGFKNVNGVLTLDTGLTGSLPPGCYGNVRINKDSELILTAGAKYEIGSFRALSMAVIHTTVAGSTATFNVKGEFISEGNVVWTDLDINLQSPNTTGTGSENIFNNTVINAWAPTGNFHLRSGSSFRLGSELIGAGLTIQPFTNDVPPPGDIPCVCPALTHLKPGSTFPLICVPD